MKRHYLLEIEGANKICIGKKSQQQKKKNTASVQKIYNKIYYDYVIEMMSRNFAHISHILSLKTNKQ